MWAAAVIPLALILALAAAVTRSEGPPVKGDAAERRRRFRCALEVAKLPDPWIRFFEQWVARETGFTFNPRAWNRSASERRYSARNARRPQNVARLAELGYSPDEWSFGSKGLGQFLGPVAILSGTGFRFPKPYIQKHGPDIAFRPGATVAILLDFSRGLMARKEFSGTWESLSAGPGLPASMDNPDRTERTGEAAERRAARLGWSRGWIHDAPPPLPRYSARQLQDIAEAADIAWETCE